jgi:hypothetical protein
LVFENLHDATRGEGAVHPEGLVSDQFPASLVP